MSKEISKNSDASGQHVCPKLSDPTPLGLASFALTTFLSSLCNAKLFSDNVEGILIGCAYAYGGVTQMLAGILSFLWDDDVFASTVFVSYGAFWIGFAYFKSFVAPALSITSNKDLNNAIGLYILCWLLFTLVLLMLSFRLTRVHVVLFTTLCLSLLFLVIGHFADKVTIIKVGGWLGVITSIFAWYIMASIMVENMFGKKLFPLGKLG